MSDNAALTRATTEVSRLIVEVSILQSERDELRRRITGLERAEQMWIVREKTSDPLKQAAWRGWFACLGVVRGEVATDWKPPDDFEPERRTEERDDE